MNAQNIFVIVAVCAILMQTVNAIGTDKTTLSQFCIGAEIIRTSGTIEVDGHKTICMHKGSAITLKSKYGDYKVEVARILFDQDRSFEHIYERVEIILRDAKTLKQIKMSGFSIPEPIASGFYLYVGNTPYPGIGTEYVPAHVAKVAYRAGYAMGTHERTIHAFTGSIKPLLTPNEWYSDRIFNSNGEMIFVDGLQFISRPFSLGLEKMQSVYDGKAQDSWVRFSIQSQPWDGGIKLGSQFTALYGPLLTTYQAEKENLDSEHTIFPKKLPVTADGYSFFLYKIDGGDAVMAVVNKNTGAITCTSWFGHHPYKRIPTSAGTKDYSVSCDKFTLRNLGIGYTQINYGNGKIFKAQTSIIRIS